MKLRGYALVLGVLFLAIGVAFITSCSNQRAQKTGSEIEASQADESAVAPEVAEASQYRNLVDGKNISLADMKGRILIVNFWATWCPPCRAEIPGFIELYSEYKDKNVTIIGISVDSGDAVVKKFIESQKINYPIIMSTKKLQADYEKFINQRIKAIPTTIVINQKGEMANVYVGAPRNPKSVFEAEIQKLLAEG